LIQVSSLSKSFGPVRALDRVSFHVPEGEILGFLGPNGAGKTTTLRILTGFLPPDEGTVTVAGHDVRSHSLQVRRAIGYLPEGVPLYPEMRVTEYLRFRSRLKGVPRSGRRAAIRGALERAGVADVERRIIGTLSKGYRQRVGLADALLGDPRILILDEPTVGLDPEQVRQFRALLKDLVRERTVLLSTHILSEVEQVATRVVIINRGRIAAQDTAENLRRRVGALDRVRVEIAPARGPRDPQGMARLLESLPEVEGVRLDGRGEREEERAEGSAYAAFTIRPRRGSDPRESVYRLARDRGWLLRELTRVPVSLEEVFIEIVAEATGRAGEEPRVPQEAGR
jgi:ABC-2 type transport system ATP-binding protein